MKCFYLHINLFAGFLFLLLTLSIQNAQGQNRVNILEADSIVGGTVEGKQVQKILGNVHLQSEELEMFCDSAYQFVNESEIRAFGNIQINTQEEKIWADKLTYFTDVDFSQLRGRVIIEADSTTLFGNSVDYRFSTKVAHFIDEIRLEDQEGILKANSGFYYREPDSAVFRGNVQLADSAQYIEGDSLFSNRRTGYYELYGDIFADDRENNTLLKGDYLEADSTGRRYLEGNAWLRNVERDTSSSAAQDSMDQKSQRISGYFISPSGFESDSSSTGNRANKISSDTSSVGGENIVHEVNSNETLFRIAQLYNVTVQNIKDWNDLSGNNVQVGQTLDIQLPQNSMLITHTVQTRETLFSISRVYEVSVSNIKSWNNLSDEQISVDQNLSIYKKSEERSSAEDSTYTVKQGDSLFKIASNYDMTVDELRTLNNLRSDEIRVGQQLLVKPQTTTQTPDTTSLTTGAADSLLVSPDSISATSPDTLNTSQPDTTHIQARKIILQKEKVQADSTTIINAHENVRIWSNKFSSISDTAKYNDDLETFELWSNPKAWHKDIQLTGPYIKVILDGGDINQLVSYTDVFVAQEDTSLNRINQLKGDTLNTYFTDGEISRMRLDGNTHILRFTKNDAGESDGALDSSAPVSIFYFDNGELYEFKHMGAIEGDFLPENESLADRKLDGYSWNPQQRPTRPAGKMEPRFPPISLERPFELPRRYLEYIDKKEAEE